jgi:BirA family biotin operon repressor/biotin-[acetyl-CoA-carboxylase] ligase
MKDPVPGAYMNDLPSFEHVARIDSTNAELMRRPLAGPPGPACALLADVQDAGRGRNGRRWLSEPGQSLTMSVGLDRIADGATLLGLPLAVGVVIAEVLGAHGARPRLKWPNDLYVASPAGAAKAGGILVEARSLGGLQRIVVGFGLNLAASDALSEAATGQPVGALFPADAIPARVPLARALGAAVAELLAHFPATGLAPYAACWRALDLLAGAPIDVLHPDGRREPGVARGIDDDGALRVEDGAGRIGRLIGGEVSVRLR